MVTTEKKIQRVTTGEYRVLYQKARPIVIVIDRDKVGFREKGRRQVYWLAMDDAFRIAVRAESARARAERKRK
jgi:hypothetical protein